MRFLRINDDSGSATIEFIAFGLIGAISVLFASQFLSDVQHRQFIVQQTAKQLARSLVSVTRPSDLDIMIETVSSSYHLNTNDLNYLVVCDPACDSIAKIEPGALVSVTVSYANSSSTVRMRTLR